MHLQSLNKHIIQTLLRLKAGFLKVFWIKTLKVRLMMIHNNFIQSNILPCLFFHLMPVMPPILSGLPPNMSYNIHAYKTRKEPFNLPTEQSLSVQALRWPCHYQLNSPSILQYKATAISAFLHTPPLPTPVTALCLQRAALKAPANPRVTPRWSALNPTPQ